MNIFHYKKKSGEYTAFNLDPTDDSDSVFISMSKGVKNGARDRLAMKLNKQELAYLILEGQKVFNSLEEKDDSKKDS